MTPTRLTRGLLSLLVLLALVLGAPALLMAVGGNPTNLLPSLNGLQQALTTPDTTGRLLIGALVLVGWALWASLVIALVIETTALARRMPAPHLPGLRIQQQIAGALLAGVAAMIVGPSAALASAAPAPQTITQTQTPAPAAAPATPTTATSQAPAAPSPKTTTVTVQPGDSLWTLAERHLGDGAQWRVLRDLNLGHPQTDGTALDSTGMLTPGWTLRIPAPEAPAATGQSVTVQPGDTLSGIAQRTTGTAQAWPELFAANKGVTQPDGARLADPNLIRPGWHLITSTPAKTPNQAPTSTPAPSAATPAPSAATPAPSAATPAPSVSAPTPAAPAAPIAPSRPHTAPAAPSENAAPAPTARADQPAPADPTTAAPNTTSPQASAGPAPVADRTPVEAADPSSHPETTAELAAPLGLLKEHGSSLLAGAGAVLLASGLTMTLRQRRRHQRAHRRPGEAIATPAAPAAALEEHLVQISEDTVLDDLNAALHQLGSLAPAAPLQFITLGATSIEAVLTEPTPLPKPWVDLDGTATAWSAERLALPAAPEGVHPYPAVAPIGTTDLAVEVDGDMPTQLLLDLEGVDTLSIVGPDAPAAMACLAVELATGTAHQNLRLTLVGFGAGLAEVLDPTIDVADDVDVLLTRLEGYTRARTAALAGHDLRQARTDDAIDDTAPHVVLIATPLTAEQVHRLHDLTSAHPHLGVAAAVANPADASGWTITIHDPGHAVLTRDALALPMTPHLLSGEDYDAVLELLRATRRPATRTAVWAPEIPSIATQELEDIAEDQARVVNPTTPLEDSAPDGDDILSELASAREAADSVAADSVDVDRDLGEDEGGVDGLLKPSSANPAEADRLDEELAELVESDSSDAVASSVPGPTGLGDVDLGAHRERLLSAAPDLESGPTHPRLLVLGSVAIENPRGKEPVGTGDPSKRSSHIQRALAAITYLTLFPGCSSSAEQLMAALVGSGAALQSSTVTQYLSRARAWVGQTDQGEPYVPIKKKGGTYEMHPEFRSDWGDFLELIGDDPTRTPLSRLEAALKLVRGRPLEGGLEARYLAFADGLRDEMLNTIVDVAHVVVVRALQDRNTRLASFAAGLGGRLDPVSQDLRCDNIRVLLATGRSAEARQAALELQAWADIEDLVLIEDADDLISHTERLMSHTA